MVLSPLPEVPMNGTDAVRLVARAKLNAEAGPRAELEARYEEVMDTAEMQERYEVYAFAAPFVVVRRKADGVNGLLAFQSRPRFYFGFTPE
jgi:hypothetical protein